MATAQRSARSCIAGSVSLAVLAMVVPAAGASAQGSTPSAAYPADIVVTAQRREQKLQDVGIAITALSSRTLKDLVIDDAPI